MTKDISVLMSVYKNDIPEDIKTAVESVLNQTLAPKQVVIVIDGPVSDEISKTLEKLKDENSKVELYPLSENVGLGNALGYGAKKCKFDLIARMDSDDIALPNRFEKQVEIFEKDESLSVVGGFAQEFFDTAKNKAGVREVPETNDKIVEFMKSRCPFCHMTVMMKKDMLLKAGNYQHWYYAEDYYLWIRMHLRGAEFYNIQEPLVLARINVHTFERRSGFKYYKSIKGLFKFMLRNKLISFFKYKKECLKRFVGHVLVPSKLKNKMYKKFLRSNAK